MSIRYKPDPKFMRMAIKRAQRNLRRHDGGPFGACIVRRGRVLAIARNTVLSNDATCHAEINAIRIASRRIGGFDLSGSYIYSTTEPCPMCFSAVHWAKIDGIVYGTSIADVRMLGFNELSISNAGMKRLGGSTVKLVPGFLIDECGELLDKWNELENKNIY